MLPSIIRYDRKPTLVQLTASNLALPIENDSRNKRGKNHRAGVAIGLGKLEETRELVKIGLAGTSRGAQREGKKLWVGMVEQPHHF